MTCKEALDFLMSYLDGELSAEQREEFERHLSICDACRDYLATYQATLRLGHAAAATDDAAAADAAVPEHLVQAILAARVKASGRP